MWRFQLNCVLYISRSQSFYIQRNFYIKISGDVVRCVLNFNKDLSQRLLTGLVGSPFFVFALSVERVVVGRPIYIFTRNRVETGSFFFIRWTNDKYEWVWGWIWNEWCFKLNDLSLPVISFHFSSTRSLLNFTFKCLRRHKQIDFIFLKPYLSKQFI